MTAIVLRHGYLYADTKHNIHYCREWVKRSKLYVSSQNDFSITFTGETPTKEALTIIEPKIRELLVRIAIEYPDHIDLNGYKLKEDDPRTVIKELLKPYITMDNVQIVLITKTKAFFILLNGSGDRQVFSALSDNIAIGSGGHGLMGIIMGIESIFPDISKEQLLIKLNENTKELLTSLDWWSGGEIELFDTLTLDYIKEA